MAVVELWVPDRAADALRAQRSDGQIGSIEQAIPTRVQAPGTVQVDQESALKHSGVWAALRLRSNLISSLPVDVYRTVAGIQAEQPKPPVLCMPDGECDITEWLWATQFDLDRFGNAFGLITARDGLGLPARIELVPVSQVSVKAIGSKPSAYRIRGKVYGPEDVWHERQYRVAGFPVGLSPLTYAAYSISGFLSAQKFALDYFGSGAMPAGTLKNVALPIVDPNTTEEAKRRFKAATQNRDIFVTGKDWEWTPSASEGATMAFLEDRKWGIVDVARYFDVPADLIDGTVAGQSVTYANIVQRNLQLLVMSLGPAIKRREVALSKLTPGDRFVKLNSDALLRMDPETRQRVIISRVKGMTLTPDEARALDDLPPLTEAQMKQMERLVKASAPKAAQPKPVTPPKPGQPELEPEEDANDDQPA